MSVFIAVLFTCGAVPEGANLSDRICVASVFHAIHAPLKKCVSLATTEAKDSEGRMVQGGFVKTTSSGKCFTLSDDAAKDESLMRYMLEEGKGKQNAIVHYDFKDGDFVKRKPVTLNGVVF